MIKDIESTYNVSEKEIKELSEIDHPLFSFKYLKDASIKKCSDHKFFFDFLMRLQKLSELGWNEIRTSSRHGFGMEPMPVSEIVTKDQLPAFVTREVELDVFRSSGDNRVLVGHQSGKIFYVFFIEAKHGDISNH